MIKELFDLVPRPLRFPVMRLARAVLHIPYYGRQRYCPVCGHWSRKFLPFGRVRREDAQCARCGALERHRLLWLFLTRRTDLLDGEPRSVLHVAPEQCLETRFRKVIGAGYLTADLLDPGAMVRMDITSIAYPDESFDVIFCNHVLEHVQDDLKAMKELRRVLKSSGWAILLVPIGAGRTYEDPSITTPSGRLKAFGREDHVRWYGSDYVDRLREAGFAVEVTAAGDICGEGDARRMGLSAVGDKIFLCRKTKK